MPMDGFTLGFITDELQHLLPGGRVDRVNQPERDSIVLNIRSGGNFKLLLCANPSHPRVQLTALNFENPQDPPMFCMLMRKHLTGSRILKVEQLDGDRILQITFDCLDEMGYPAQKRLILEMMGRYSNLILLNENDGIIDAIRHVNSEMSRVRTVLPGGLYNKPSQSGKIPYRELTAGFFTEHAAEDPERDLFSFLTGNLNGLAKVCTKEICARIGIDTHAPVGDIDAGLFCEAWQKVMSTEIKPVILLDENGIVTDWFAFPYMTYAPQNQKDKGSFQEAMDAFFAERDLQLRMQQRSLGLQKHIRSALDRTRKKKSIMQDTLDQHDKNEKYRIWGDLLTANLYRLHAGQEEAVVEDYYEESMPAVTIPLSPRLDPNGNAQQYYKKYRKGKLAEQYALEQMGQIDTDIELLENAIEDLNKCETSTDLAEVRQVLVQSGFMKPQPGQKKGQKKLKEGTPYRFTATDGTLIEVGKNALQNDRLTLHARGNETWLHVQGIPGSHVIIRTESEPVDETLLYAAKLAVYFSRGRNQAKQPVDITRRKYVKKSANAPAGLVTYTNFSTLIIGLEPEDMTAIADSVNKMHKK